MSPDDVCILCYTKRDQHGDRQHKFSLDGQLEKIDPPAPPRQVPPVSDIAHQLANQMSTQLVLKLVERMVAKDMLTADDMLYIFSGSAS